VHSPRKGHSPDEHSTTAVVAGMCGAATGTPQSFGSMYAFQGRQRSATLLGKLLTEGGATGPLLCKRPAPRLRCPALPGNAGRLCHL
jgi:hypothetical protein